MRPIPNARAKQWIVPREMIIDMESRLPRFVSDNPGIFNSSIPIHPWEFRRKYCGIEEGGRQFISVTLYRIGFVSRRAWLNGICVSGGAAHDNWSVRYYPDTKSFGNPYPFPIDRSAGNLQPPTAGSRREAPPEE